MYSLNVNEKGNSVSIFSEGVRVQIGTGDWIEVLLEIVGWLDVLDFSFYSSLGLNTKFLVI
ncbi:MAG: hypothetical protein JKY88_05115 [Pseudomonadales bacterium]|nr:hypothetical protein [Pseudomonadales bacterium]